MANLRKIFSLNKRSNNNGDFVLTKNAKRKISAFLILLNLFITLEMGVQNFFSL